MLVSAVTERSEERYEADCGRHCGTCGCRQNHAVEALLYNAGVTRKLGRVDHGDSFLDTNQIERERGITIFTEPAVIESPNMELTLLDTPGHVDFSAETERTLRVLDYAVLVVSASDGIQGSHGDVVAPAQAV